jgi:hypothetical protein
MRKNEAANLKRKQNSEIYQSEVDQRVDVAWKLRRRLIFGCFFFFVFFTFTTIRLIQISFIFLKWFFPAEDDKYRY